MKIRIKNKKTFTIVLSIVLVLTAMISGTYSLFYHENTAQSKEDYTTGILAIVAKSKSDNINLTNALPMTDEEGVETDPYVFTIENTGNLDYNFNIRLLSTSDNPINPDYIKLKIDDGEVTTLSSLTNSIIKDDITLKAKEVMDVSIRIWLASNTPNTEIGKSFNSKIVTEGQAVYTEMNNERPPLYLAQYITELYNDNKDEIVESNNIQYQYATSVNLMNDKLGGIADSLDGGNIRYYGKTPNNYIDVGDRTSSNGVMLWRIIGVFDGGVRIIPAYKYGNHLGDYSWDSSAREVNYGYGINEWSQADIMKLLNPGYENNEDYDKNGNLIKINNSLYWNNGSGTCYRAPTDFNSARETTTCSFTDNGLEDIIKTKIVDQTVYLGEFSKPNVYVNEAYNIERGTDVIQNPKDGIARTTRWTGKVALMYPSDYGYATDLNNCNGKNLGQYSNNSSCKNWLSESIYQWTVSSDLSYDSYVVYIDSNGGVSSRPGYRKYGLLRPVLLLKSDAEIEYDGEGTVNNPYVLK